MIEIYNSELLENAGLVAICDDESVTIYTREELTNGFKKGDIIAKKEEYLKVFDMDSCLCRYCGFDGKALNTDAFLIKRGDGTTETYNRYFPMKGLGYTDEYRLATPEEKEYFEREIKNAEYIDY